MGLKRLLIVSCIVGCIAVFWTAEQCSEYRELLKSKWDTLLKTCPYHVALDWWNKLGSSEEGQAEERFAAVRQGNDKLFTKEELAKYKGEEGSLGLYLGILGRVYDVSKGAKYYEPGGGYAFFSGRDGTKAFMTGDFTDGGLVDEVTGLTPPQMLELETWVKFYEDNYIYKGKVIGNFYDENGAPTAALKKAQESIDEGYHQKELAAKEKKIFPPCNSRWSQADGTIVWCSNKSGGETRDWVGVPMKFFKAGTKSARCACVRNTGPPSGDPNSSSNNGDVDSPLVQRYDGCNFGATECRIKPKQTDD